MALLIEGERFGQLEVIEKAAPDYWRCRCLRCKYDGALATVDALVTCKVTQCFHCNELAKMTPQQRAAFAFRRSLHLTPPREELDRVDTIPSVASLTIGDALAA
jgi:hypothetical protein